MCAAPAQRWTPETYLAFERTSEEKHEYWNGQIFAMAGASARHNLIAANVLAAIHPQLRQSPCTVYPSDLRLKIPDTNLYTYPDISVVCGELEFEDAEQDTLLNPILLIEVLSPSTENYDRGQKFAHYRTLSSLREVLFIAQSNVHVEHYRRQPDDKWLLSDIVQPDTSLSLQSIDCTLSVADIYAKVDFSSDR